MPEKTVPSYQYADDQVRLAVDPADQDGMIRLRAASGGCGTAMDLTVIGAQRLTTMLGAAITASISRGLRPNPGR